MRCPRTIATVPSSSGWRSDSSAGRLNSESSSRKRMPWWASVASPGCGDGPPPTRPGRRDRVVRRAKRALAHELVADVAPGDAVDARHGDRLVARERRQDRGHPPREHRLAGSRRTREQEVVSARGGDRQRADRLRVTADVGQIGLAAAGRRSGDRRRQLGRRRAAQNRRHLVQVRHAGHLEPVDERRLARALARNDEAGDPGVARALGDAQHAAAVAQLAAERQLAEHRPARRARPRAAARRRRARRTPSRDRSRGRPCAGARARG